MIAALAVRTGTDPAVWDQLLVDDPRMLATVADLLAGER